MDDDMPFSDAEDVFAEAAAVAAVPETPPYMKYEASRERKECDDGPRPAPLWLITFTDVMALMLTFFVLLYAMSAPQEEKWEEIASALTNNPNTFSAKAFNAGTQDVISIDKIGSSRALNLDYLESLITGMLEEKGVKDILIFQNDRRLIVSLPSEILFQTGRAEIGREGKDTLFVIAGVLDRVKNRLEVIGHTDPRPIQGARGPYRTNWELSLARSGAVANVLRDVGYMRPVTVRGLSSGRYEELPRTIKQSVRYDLSRRVDIVLMEDSGYRRNAFDTK